MKVREASIQISIRFNRDRSMSEGAMAFEVAELIQRIDRTIPLTDGAKLEVNHIFYHNRELPGDPAPISGTNAEGEPA